MRAPFFRGFAAPVLPGTLPLPRDALRCARHRRTIDAPLGTRSMTRVLTPAPREIARRPDRVTRAAALTLKSGAATMSRVSGSGMSP